MVAVGAIVISISTLQVLNSNLLLLSNVIESPLTVLFRKTIVLPDPILMLWALASIELENAVPSPTSIEPGTNE
jgi:hypothetical protein